ncbi:MAG: hypothetical protein ACREJC_22790 [Tepidisphaeraceae bacterium]
MLVGNGCAGIDFGDGFDCYGLPVHPNDPRTRRLTGLEIADVWRRLRLPEKQFYSFEEQAHLRAGTFGAEGLAFWTQQTGGVVPVLPPVHIVGRMGWPLLLLALVIANAVRPYTRRDRGIP